MGHRTGRVPLAQPSQRTNRKGEGKEKTVMAAPRHILSLLVLLLTALLPEMSGLLCNKCLGTRENCTDQQQHCTSRETVCMEETRATYDPISETLKRGCSTPQYCQSYFSVHRGFVSRSIYCCPGDLCNRITYNVTYNTKHNGVECHSCIGSVEECDGGDVPTTQCRGTKNRCVEIFRQWLPGTGLAEPVIKGCGDYPHTGTLLAYGIGDSVSYAAVRVCDGSRCNNSSFTEFAAGKRNGLQCYSCLDTGHGQCSAENLQKMLCVGTMDRCMTVVDYARNIRIRAGCANRQLCQVSTFYRALMPKLPVSYVTCCQGLLCNGGREQGVERNNAGLVALLAAPLLIALNNLATTSPHAKTLTW